MLYGRPCAGPLREAQSLVAFSRFKWARPVYCVSGLSGRACPTGEAFPRS